MQDIFRYDLCGIDNKEVVVYGCDEISRKFAMRLINNDIKFHYFLNILKAENCISGKYLNKTIFNVDELKRLDEKQIVIVAPYNLHQQAKRFLTDYQLQHLLVKLETFEDGLLEKNVVIYGTGISGKRNYLFYANFLNIIGFCDGNIKKQGTYFMEKYVYAPEELKNTAILIASDSYLEIKEQLH